MISNIKICIVTQIKTPDTFFLGFRPGGQVSYYATDQQDINNNNTRHLGNTTKCVTYATQYKITYVQNVYKLKTGDNHMF